LHSAQLTPAKYRNQFLPKDIKIVGYARTKMDHDEYLRRIKSYIKTPTKDIEQQLEEFCSLCSYVSGQYDKDESFQQLNKHLEELEQGKKEQNRLFYMALPPSVFTIVSQHLKKCCYPSNGIARVVVSIEPANVPIALVINPTLRSRNRLAKILLAPESCRNH
jgi:glucose-6-phosphate 1-dehydrogenase